MKILNILLIVFVLTAFCHAEETDRKAKAKKPTKKDAVAKTDAGLPVKLDPKGEAHPPNIWMQQKLKHSQKIFAGMVEGDLFAVEDAAKHLMFLNRLEYFVHGKTKGYRTQLKQFQYANTEILKGAKEKNLDRVTLGYNQMTNSCVACHKQLRRSK